jgi:hypothetical protein
MAEHVRRIEISQDLALLRLAEEVQSANVPRVLRGDDEDLAMVASLLQPRGRRRGRVKTQADYKASRRAAGGWKDLIDVDRFIEDIYESRRISTRPPVEL